jgi:hypothetical protein
MRAQARLFSMRLSPWLPDGCLLTRALTRLFLCVDLGPELLCFFFGSTETQTQGLVLRLSTT